MQDIYLGQSLDFVQRCSIQELLENNIFSNSVKSAWCLSTQVYLKDNSLRDYLYYFSAYRSFPFIFSNYSKFSLKEQIPLTKDLLLLQSKKIYDSPSNEMHSLNHSFFNQKDLFKHGSIWVGEIDFLMLALKTTKSINFDEFKIKSMNYLLSEKAEEKLFWIGEDYMIINEDTSLNIYL